MENNYHFSEESINSSISFRSLVNATSYPGRHFQITKLKKPSILSNAAATILITLCDNESNVYLSKDYSTDEVKDWLIFNTGAIVSDKQSADFAVGDWESLLPLDEFKTGVPEYPERSATLIIEESNYNKIQCNINGPGIKDKLQIDLPNPELFIKNSHLYPLGLDFYFTNDLKILSIPRSTKINVINSEY